MYTVCFIFAACNPPCENGGTCRSSSSNASCDCPSGYQGSYCQNRGAHNQEHACMHAAIGPWSVCTLCVSYLQLVVPPVGMEEHALVQLPMLPVSVPVGTQGPTARTEVLTQPKTCIHVCVCVCVCVYVRVWHTVKYSSHDRPCIFLHTTYFSELSWCCCCVVYMLQDSESLLNEAYICTLCVSYFAACSPACQNGGICRSSRYSAYCVCPSGYSGSYCQNRGIDTTRNMHKRVCLCMQVCACMCVCVHAGVCMHVIILSLTTSYETKNARKFHISVSTSTQKMI